MEVGRVGLAAEDDEAAGPEHDLARRGGRRRDAHLGPSRKGRQNVNDDFGLDILPLQAAGIKSVRGT